MPQEAGHRTACTQGGRAGAVLRRQPGRLQELALEERSQVRDKAFCPSAIHHSPVNGALLAICTGSGLWLCWLPWRPLALTTEAHLAIVCHCVPLSLQKSRQTARAADGKGMSCASASTFVLAPRADRRMRDRASFGAPERPGGPFLANVSCRDLCSWGLRGNIVER